VAGALAHLPLLVDVGETPLTPGTWCWNAPLWGNPLLPYDRHKGVRAGLEHEHPDLMEYRELRTMGNLVRARAELGLVTVGWDTIPGEWTPREARKANQDWRAFVSAWTPWRGEIGGGTGAGGKVAARS
jgi:hypothetical protein